MTRSRRFVPLAALAFGLLPGMAFPSLAFADAGFTPDQRQEIIAIVRQALKDDPSILRDAVLSMRAQQARQEETTQKSLIASHAGAVTDARGDGLAGNPAGNVTLTEFYDPRCPYCQRMVPVINQLVASDPKLRVVFKLIPILGPQSVLESRAIAAAGQQGAYVPMQEAVMRESAPVTMDKIEATARSLKLDPARLARDMNDPAITAHLNDNVALAKALHIDGTPAIVIGDDMISGAVDLGDLQKAVTAARS